MMRFAQPAWLWLLLLIPLLLWWRGRQGKAAAILFSSGELVREVSKARKYRSGNVLFFLRLLTLILLLVALARPQKGRGTTEIEASGIDIVLAVDISPSMRALDLQLDGKTADRLTVVKAVTSKFIQARPNDRLGLVAFGGQSYLVSPLTLDHTWLGQNLDRLKVGLLEDGTAIGSGIATSVNRLRDQPSKSKIIILLTDGSNNAGKVVPLTAAEAARTLGIKIYTIGAGAQDVAPMPVKDQWGREFIAQVPCDVDEDTLQKVAELTGGKFYRATDTESLKRIYAEIDRLEKTTVKMKKFEHYQELFAWFLIPGLMAMGTEILLAQTLFRRLP